MNEICQDVALITSITDEHDVVSFIWCVVYVSCADAESTTEKRHDNDDDGDDDDDIIERGCNFQSSSLEGDIE